MNGYCPTCGREDSLALIKGTEDFNVRGEIIPVEVEYYRCENCGEEIMQLQTDDDPLEKAYREYRRRKDMLQPEEIRKFRQSLGLTQKELSGLLGIGVASLSRYENGALQEQAHDQILKFGMDTSNMLKLIEEKRDVLGSEKKSELTHQIQQGKESKRLIDLVYDHHGKYDASILTGFQPLQVDKLTEAIKYFCYEDRIPKTKLMKLLFYADFKHYKEYGRSITGIQYAHLPYGPVPDKYDLWISTIRADNPGICKDEVWFNENPAEIITSNDSADISMFENSEVLVLATVKEIFKNFSARKITDFSHQEEGYRETRNGQIISYEYAKKLRI